MASNKIRLADLFRYYRALPHQLAAITELEHAIDKANPHILGRDQGWFKTWSVAGKQSNFPNSWEGVLEAARVAGAKFPELVAAQWACESGYGKFVSGRHNYFGLKGSGTGTKTQEFINNQWITITAEFIDFPDLLSSVMYLVERWYKDYKQYRGCNNAGTREEAAKWLVKEGYATDPNYAGKLIQLMDQHAGAEPAIHPREKILRVPYEYQLGADDGPKGYRQCFSSSCAMLLQYLKPGTLKGANGDDQYLKRVQSYGDTTDPTAQIRALSSYGIKARFTKVAGFATLEQQINAGVPVPCGFLHRGPVSAPSGGGHWLIVGGYTKDHLIVHDPFGEADLVSGTTLGGVARFARYSRRNFGPRWMVEGSNTGWAIIAER